MAEGCQRREHSSVTIDARKFLGPTRQAKANALHRT